MKRIEVFRTGTHRPMSGNNITVTDRQLRLTAAAYDPDLHKAPLCIGHPRTDAPAYGWVQGLEFAGGVLSAYVDDVDPSFAQAVNDRRYRSVSASFWLPDAETNPKPGILSLRHVGFLGAVPPAVKGLKAVSFADDDDAVVLFGGGADGEEEAPPPEPPREKRGRSARAASLTEREAEMARREAEMERKDVAAFCDGLQREGRLIPALRGMTETLLLSASKTETVSFSEADGGPLDTRAGLMRLLGLMPKAVEFGELAGGPGPEAGGAGAAFDLPAGYRADPARAALLARAEAIAAKEGVSFAEAVRRADAEA